MAVTSATSCPVDASLLSERFRNVRATTERLCEPLAVEDYWIQCMADAITLK